MELSSAAVWLNTAFAGYDNAVLNIMHTLADKAGAVLTPLMRVVSFLGEKGIIFFLLALGFLCFSKTRKMGVCLFGAVCCGALITNVVLKDLVARPRPFEAVEAFSQWWSAVGAPAEDGFSFPSGHVTAAAAGTTALCLMRGRKLILPSVVWVFLMAVSRNYLMAHYPSDVLFAALIGCFSAVVAFFITKLIYRLLEEHSDIPIFALVLDYSVPVPFAIGGVERSRGKDEHGRGSGKSQRNDSKRGGSGYRGKHEA